MNEKSTKRNKIFQVYSNNLKLLQKNKLIPNAYRSDVYVCPICTDPFGIEALDQSLPNPLTLEDVPPVSLGGKANILTCRSCNNKSGQTYDFQLKDRLLELDYLELVPGTEFPLKVEKDGITVGGKAVISGNGQFVITHDEKKNNPQALGNYIQSADLNTEVNMNPTLKITDDQLVDVAILKICYLSLFEKFGYSFILDTKFDVFREQILNPMLRSYRLFLMMDIPNADRISGLFYVTEIGLESFMFTFKLKSPNKTRTFTIFIPINDKTSTEIAMELRKRIQLYKHYRYEYSFKAQKVDIEEESYLSDLSLIKDIQAWVKGKEGQ